MNGERRQHTGLRILFANASLRTSEAGMNSIPTTLQRPWLRLAALGSLAVLTACTVPGLAPADAKAGIEDGAGGADAVSLDVTKGPDATTGDAAPVDAGADVGPDAKPVMVTVGGATGMAINVLDKAAKMTVTLRVTDPNGQPLAKATVSGAGISAQVVNGVATLSGISVAVSPVITVTASGFASSSLMLDPARALAGPTLVLRPFEGSATFPAVLGGTLKLPAASITIAAGSVQGPDGKAYNGKVTVSAASIDLDRDLIDPLHGISAVAAATLPDPMVMVDTGSGMAPVVKLASTYVDLNGAAGEKLQLAAGKPATVAFKLSGKLDTVLPTAYAAGAKLDVASRDGATGKWTISSQCNVAKGVSGWTCTASVPHFSEAAVVQKQGLGCLVVGDLQLSATADKTVVWRQQSLVGPFNLPMKAHFFDNQGKFGMCALVPLAIGGARLMVDYQLAPKGTPVAATPIYNVIGTTQIRRNFSLGQPSDQGLDKIANIDTTSLDACLKACGAAPQQALAVGELPPAPATEPKPSKLPPPPVAAAFPVVDFTKIDADGDGSPASDDCDDSDPKRSPLKGEVCGDGIDQDCTGKDLLCPLLCVQAGDACMPKCSPDGKFQTAADTACVGECSVPEPFVSKAAADAWTAFKTCVSTCPDGACMQAKCEAALMQCTGEPGTSCGAIVACRLGCWPLNLAGAPAAYGACLAACPPGPQSNPGEPSPYADVDSLIVCGGSTCLTSLQGCAATNAKPTSTCKDSDLGCYAETAACGPTYNACFAQ